jgi:hypothetical protein
LWFAILTIDIGPRSTLTSPAIESSASTTGAFGRPAAANVAKPAEYSWRRLPVNLKQQAWRQAVPARNTADYLACFQRLFNQPNLVVEIPAAPTFSAQ